MVRVQARVVQARVATQTEPRVRRLCLGRQVIHCFLASEDRIVRSENKSIATDTCWQDCVGVGALNMISNPSCLSDCFPPAGPPGGRAGDQRREAGRERRHDLVGGVASIQASEYR